MNHEISYQLSVKSEYSQLNFKVAVSTETTNKYKNDLSLPKLVIKKTLHLVHSQ